jgi:hypothetical protein
MGPPRFELRSDAPHAPRIPLPYGPAFCGEVAPGIKPFDSEHSTEYEQGTWRRLAERLGENGYDTGADDLLDALVLAVTARVPAGEFHHLPPDSPRDAADLPMQMVYRRPEPFDIDG